MKLFFSTAFCCLVFNGFSQSFRLSGTAFGMTSDEVAGMYNNGGLKSSTALSQFGIGLSAILVLDELIKE